jgi:uncharacterized membrane protein
VITIEESIDIQVPVSTANAEWEAFESSQDRAADATFLELDENRTRVIVQISYEPQSMHEPLVTVVGIADRRISDELESFKEFIEHRLA